MFITNKLLFNLSAGPGGGGQGRVEGLKKEFCSTLKQEIIVLDKLYIMHHFSPISALFISWETNLLIKSQSKGQSLEIEVMFTLYT